MNTALFTCLIIGAVIVVAYLIYMAIGLFLFNRAAKKHGVQRTIIKIGPKRKRKGKGKSKKKR